MVNFVDDLNRKQLGFFLLRLWLDFFCTCKSFICCYTFLNETFWIAVDTLIRENMVGIAEDKSNSYENICTRSYIDPSNFIVLLRKGINYYITIVFFVKFVLRTYLTMDIIILCCKQYCCCRFSHVINNLSSCWYQHLYR